MNEKVRYYGSYYRHSAAGSYAHQFFGAMEKNNGVGINTICSWLSSGDVTHSIFPGKQAKAGHIGST